MVLCLGVVLRGFVWDCYVFFIVCVGLVCLILCCVLCFVFVFDIVLVLPCIYSVARFWDVCVVCVGWLVSRLVGCLHACLLVCLPVCLLACLLASSLSSDRRWEANTQSDG